METLFDLYGALVILPQACSNLTQWLENTMKSPILFLSKFRSLAQNLRKGWGGAPLACLGATSVAERLDY